MNQEPSELSRQRLEEGLAQLRQMGYLSTPAQRYVASHAPLNAGSARASAYAAVWIGAGAGSLVGLVLWLSALMADSSLLDRPSDMLWLLLDFGLLATVLGMLIVFFVLWPVLSWVYRRDGARTGLFQRIAAWVPGVLLALYLTDALGRYVLPHLGGSWGLLACAAALLTALFGALVTMLLNALLAVARLRLKGHWNIRPEGLLQRWLPFLGMASLALLLLFAGPYRDQLSPPHLDELLLEPSSPNGEQLLIVSVDGVDLDALRSAPSTMPYLSSLLVSTEELGSLAPTQSAAGFWSDVATGFSSADHGMGELSANTPHGVGEAGALSKNPILSIVVKFLLPGIGLGNRHASDQRELSRPQLWEIAAYRGRRAAVINWWATYPAARHERLSVVSDRWFLRLWESRSDAAADSHLVSPIGLAERLVRRGEAIAPDVLQRAFRYRAERRSIHRGDSLLAREEFESVPQRASLVDVWSFATTADACHVMLASALAEQRAQDLLVVHLSGYDILQRRLRAAALAEPGDLETQRNSIVLSESYGRFLDELLSGMIASHAGPVLLLSATAEGSDTGRRAWSIWLGEGSPTLGGRTDSVVPAALRLLGVEPAQDMWGGGNGPASYGARPRWAPTAPRRALDLDRLESLGYIGGS